MKIAIITAGGLPVPATKGGAVENLIEHFLKENEVSMQNEITVFSIFDADANDVSKKYKYTKFVYIKTDGIICFLKKVILFLFNKLFPKFYVGNLFINCVIKKMKSLGVFDAILIENAPQYALCLPKSYNGKIFSHLHNDFFSQNSILTNSIIERTTRFICISKYIQKTVKAADKTALLYNGIDVKAFANVYTDSQLQELREKYNIKKDSPIVFFSGRTIKQKGILELVEAFSLLPKKYNATLVIAGATFYKLKSADKYSKDLAQKAKLSKNKIVFTGYVNYWDMPKLLALSTIAVVPSIWEEPASLTTPEAMAAGKALIVSDAGGIPELVSNECAFIVKRGETFVSSLKDSMEYLLENTELAIKMGNEGKIRAKNYDYYIYAQNLDKILHNSIK